MERDDNSVGFALKGIKTEQFAILKDLYKPDQKIDLATNIQFQIDETNEMIGVFLAFEFIQTGSVFLKISVSCHFKVKGDSWRSFQTEQTKLQIPKGFMAHLTMITVGTARGILFAKTEGSEFSRLILPTINVEKMIPEDVVINL